MDEVKSGEMLSEASMAPLKPEGDLPLTILQEQERC